MTLANRRRNFDPATLRNIRGALRSRPVFPAQEFELLPGMFSRCEPFKVVPGREQITAETAMVTVDVLVPVRQPAPQPQPLHNVHALTLRVSRAAETVEVLQDHASGLTVEYEAPERLLVRNVTGALRSGVVRVVGWGT